MRNYINLKLAEDRDIGEERISNLNHLHFMMDCMIDTAQALKEDRDWKTCRPAFVEGVHHLEFLMQDEWGFGRDSLKHTHVARIPNV